MFKYEAPAHDALQEAFLRVWEKAGSYNRSQGKPLTWITSIARYHALDVLRSRRSTVSRDSDYGSELARAAETAQSMESQLVEGQLLSLCLERLDPGARECVAHAYCGGYTHREISEITGRALGTVKSWIKRSLISLRECIDELS